MWASSFILSEYDRLQTSTESTESDLASNVVLPRFSPDTILALCQEASEMLQKKPTLLNLTGEFYVIGDLHGNIRDLLRILVAARFQVTDVKLLFLGDYVDRGEFSIEVISLLLAMMIQFPDRVFLLRGNHEFAEVNEKYGFRDQLINEYSAPFSKLKENIVKSLNLNCHSEKNGSKPSGNKRGENRNGESKGGESKKFGDKNNEVKNDVKNGEMKNSEEKNGVCNQNQIGKEEIDAKTMQAFREMEKKFGVRSKCITMEEYYSKIKESPDEDSVNPDAGVNSFSSPAAATSYKGKINSDHSKLNEDMVKSAGYSLWRTFNDSVFSYLPLVAIINKELFCVHGGISHHVKSLSKIEEIQRPIYTYADNELIADLMWSDPTSKFSQYLLSTRGYGTLFGIRAIDDFLQDLGLTGIIRAHQYFQHGIDFFYKKKVITLFSCSNYCDSYSNECCYGFVDSESQVKIYQMNPLPTLKRNSTVFKNTRREFLAQNCENRGQLPLAMNVPGMIFLNTLKIPGRRSYSPSHSSASTTMVRKRVNYIGLSNMGANTSARGRTNSAKEVSIISPKIDHLKRLSLHLSVAPPKIFHSRANSSRIIDFKI